MAKTTGNNSDSKGSGKENRTGQGQKENRGNRKLPDQNGSEPQRTNTAGDTSNGKYSRTGIRKDEKESRPNNDHSGAGDRP
ncbi:MAG: hypothetical protein EOP49_10450 [Sphingobacteriales bacterium]|nr:MAG: hypothetical protein EOP49_10450 [Sphingobacteriales bacterium]